MSEKNKYGLCSDCASIDKPGYEKPCVHCNGASEFSKKLPSVKQLGLSFPYKISDFNGEEDSSHNNGGSTDYYDFEKDWKECQDVIEGRNMNFSQGNIFKVCFCFNTGRHDGTNYERELNKIIFFANRELERIKK